MIDPSDTELRCITKLAPFVNQALIWKGVRKSGWSFPCTKLSSVSAEYPAATAPGTASFPGVMSAQLPSRGSWTFTGCPPAEVFSTVAGGAPLVKKPMFVHTPLPQPVR